MYGPLLEVGGNQPIYHPYFPYRHPFSAASWYYAKGINTDVNTLIQIFTDVRLVGFLPPHFWFLKIPKQGITRIYFAKDVFASLGYLNKICG